MPARIEVFCRVRPIDVPPTPHVVAQAETNQIHLTRGIATARGTRPVGTSEATYTFAFDRVFAGGADSQEEVYRATTARLVEEGVLRGIHATVLGHGPPHTGTTYTLFGGHDYRTRGIAPRAIQHLYDGIARATGEQAYTVMLTFVQVAGERVVDLLASVGGASAPASTAARPNVSLSGDGTVLRHHITERACPTEAEALAAMLEGLYARRSLPPGGHDVLTLHVRSQSLLDSDAAHRVSCFHLVQLAGAQRMEDLATPAERSRALVINRSLSMFEQVVLALAGGPGGEEAPRRRYVPYRQSKLTTLLRGGIGGNCLTSLIVHVVPEVRCIESTFLTLSFAKRMMRVTVTPTVNVTEDPATQIRTLQRQVTTLQGELRMQAQLSSARAAEASGGGGGGGGGPRGPGRFGSYAASSSSHTAAFAARSGDAASNSLGVDELHELQGKLQSFLDGTSATLPVSSVREMHAGFALLRSLVEEKDHAMAELRAARTSPEVPGSTPAPRASTDRPSGTRGRRVSKRGTLAALPVEPADTFSPSTLAPNTGVSYGVSSRPSKGLREIPSQVVRRFDSPPLPAPSLPPPPPPPPAVLYSPIPRPPVTAAAEGGGATVAPEEIFSEAVGPGPAGTASTTVPPASAAERLLPATMKSKRGRGLKSGFPSNWTPPFDNDVDVRESPVGRPVTQPALLQPIAGPPPSSAPGKTRVGALVSRSEAFENYKRTPPGNLQLRSVSRDRAQLLVKEEAVETLERQLALLAEAVQSKKATEGMTAGAFPGSQGSLPYALAPRPPTSLARDTPPSDCPALLDVQPEGEDLSSMSLVQLSARRRRVKARLTEAISERDYLVKQIERYRVTFLNNFNEWYAELYGPGEDGSSRPATSPSSAFGLYRGDGGPGSSRLPPATASSPRPPYPTAFEAGLPSPGTQWISGVQSTFAESFAAPNDRTMDVAERFDSMERARNTAQHPEGSSYFAAKRLVDSRHHADKRRVFS